MKNMKKLVTFFMIFTIIVLIGTMSFAKVNPKDYTTQISLDGNGKAVGYSNLIIGAVNLVGILIFFITVAVIGVKYIAASVEERADYKRTMIPILIGAFFLFGLPNIIMLVYNIVRK